MPKEKELNTIFKMKYGNSGAFHSYKFKLKWKGKILENRQVYEKEQFLLGIRGGISLGRKNIFTRWKQIDLSATTGIKVSQDELAILLRHRSSNERMAIITFQFENSSHYTTWLYYILVSLAKHTTAVIKDSRLEGLKLGEGQKSQDRLLKVKARRDRVKFDSEHKVFKKAKKTGVGDLPRAMGSDKVISGDKGGQYKIGRQLGSGGQGLVFNANADFKIVLCKMMGLNPDLIENWEPGDHPVVVKVAYKDGTDKILDMIREARILASLGRHKNIAKLLDVVIGKEACYLIIEKGDYTLDECVEKNPIFTSKDRLKIAMGFLNGLVHMHKRSVYHHDIKPENILMFGKIPKLIDFGAAYSRSLGDFTKTTIGTPKYSAPESPGATNIKTQQPSPYATPLPTKKSAIAERYALYDSFSAGLCFFECLLGAKIARDFSKDSYNIELSGLSKARDYWHKKMENFVTKDPILRALAETARKMTEIDFKTRLSVHDAKKYFKDNFQHVLGPMIISGESSDSRQVTQNLITKVKKMETMVTWFRCRFCGNEFPYKPIRCKCGRPSATPDGPTFEAIDPP